MTDPAALTALRQYLSEVADRIIEMNGACAHDWLVGVARRLKSGDPAAARSGAPLTEDAVGERICSQLHLDYFVGPLAQQRVGHLIRAELAALAAARLAQQQENEALKTERDEWIVRFNKLPEIVSRAEERGRLKGDLAADPDSDQSNHARRDLNLVTDNPAVMAVMGTESTPCSQLGCQYELTEAARLAAQQENERLNDRLARAEAGMGEATVGWNVETQRADAAEAAVTALRQDLQALPRYDTEIVGDHNSAHVTSYQDEDGEWIKARDLADRLAREEPDRT